MGSFHLFGKIIVESASVSQSKTPVSQKATCLRTASSCAALGRPQQNWRGVSRPRKRKLGSWCKDRAEKWAVELSPLTRLAIAPSVFCAFFRRPTPAKTFAFGITRNARARRLIPAVDGVATRISPQAKPDIPPAGGIGKMLEEDVDAALTGTVTEVFILDRKS